MLKKILVPLDGSALSDRILGQVHRLLVREDARIRLLGVLPPRQPGSAAPAAERHLEEHCETLCEEGARASFATTLSGDPATGILDYAAKYRPSLIAMSTHGRTGLRRWRRGSVAERVLRASPFPLLLWNPYLKPSERPRSVRFGRILVPLDGSEQSARILPLVKALARLYGSKVTLFHATELYPVASDYPMVQLPPTPREVARALAPFRRRLAGISVSVRSSLGTPAATILDAAEGEKAELIAMATHGRSGLSRWAYGSVAEQVLRHTSRPLLLLRTAGPHGRRKPARRRSRRARRPSR